MGGGNVIELKESNTQEIKDHRDYRNYLKHSQMKYRIIEIIKHIKGKRVLDLGCVQSKDKMRNGDWLHAILCREADYVLGVDYAENEVEELKKLGFNVVCSNVENMELNELFDVIVSGELIEHITNVGLFLEKCSKHLKSGGKLIITTPNPFCFHFFIKNIKRPHQVHTEHVAWYDEVVLVNLMKRYGFYLEDLKYLKPPWGASKIPYNIGFKRFASKNLFAVFKKVVA